ncbi:MAG: tetratricopeptide repeat protein [Cyclobacteriaceae bacterium]
MHKGPHAILLTILLWIAVHGSFAQRNVLDKLIQETELQVSRNNLEAALPNAHRIVQLFPTSPDGYLLRARIYEGLGKNAAALTDLGLAIAVDPENPESRFMRGMLAYRNERLDLARIDFRFLLKTKESVTNTVFFRQNNFQGTDRITTMQSGPTDQLLHLLGLVEIKAANYKRAIEILDSAAVINRYEADVFAHRGLAYEKIGNDSLANRDYEIAFKLNPDHPIVLANQSIRLSKTGKAEESKARISQAIQINPRSPDLYAERAWLHLEEKNFEAALQDYDSAIRRDPNNTEWWYNRGLALEKCGKPIAAFDSFGKALILDERNAKAWFMQGYLQLKKNQFSEAVKSFTNAITIDSNYGMAYQNRAIAYYRMGQLQQACADVEQATQLAQPEAVLMKKKMCR